jgi:hypothetical protein
MELTGDVVLAGDWHGNAPQGLNVIDYAVREGIKIIIQIGDFGIWQDDKPYLNKLQNRLGEHDIILYFIDGNHEDFPRLYAKKIGEDGTRKVRANIFHLPRGFRFTWEGYRVLALGGAASIDKPFRREGRSWWPEELITEEDVQASIEGGPVDILLAHDSPRSAPNSVTDDPYGQSEASRYFGGDMVYACNEHRRQLQRVTDVVTPRLVFHGHYHMAMTGLFHHEDDARTSARVFGLDQGTGRLPRHTMTLRTDWVAEELSALDNIQ